MKILERFLFSFPTDLKILVEGVRKFAFVMSE